jgi:hypothetical protein
MTLKTWWDEQLIRNLIVIKTKNAINFFPNFVDVELRATMSQELDIIVGKTNFNG